MGKNALKLIEGVISDNQLPFTLLTVANLHRRAQALGQALLETCNIRIRFSGFDRCRFTAQPLANQGLGLTNGEPPCDNVSRPFNLLIFRQTEQCTGVAHLQVAMGQHGLDDFRQRDQAQQVGHGHAGFTHCLGHLLLGQLEFLLQTLQGDGLFDRVEVFALDVLDQRHGDGGFIRYITHHRGDGFLAGLLARAPAAFTGDDLKAAATDRAHDDRLHDALGLDRVGQFLQRLGVHVPAWLVFAALDQVQGQVLQLIVVRPIGGGRFEIIAGERRWRASQQAGKETIPAMVRDVPDETAIAMALIENIQREDLNPVEEAIALQRLQQEFQLTQQQVADAVGKSRVTVSNLLRLIALPEVIKTMLSHGDLEMGHARALLGLPENQQVEGARHVVARGLTVRQTEALVRQWLSGKPAPVETTKPDPDIARLEQRLAERLGSAVQIRHGKKGKGQLVIGYNSLDELQGVLAHIR